jgi:hypothetical protein
MCFEDRVTVKTSCNTNMEGVIFLHLVYLKHTVKCNFITDTLRKCFFFFYNRQHQEGNYENI